MHLKRLELQGFKSFAQRTVLEFPGAVTAIVGPNGSGKSNIIDGIRWILGEREAKNIRAEKSENLLYGGTLTKPRAGFAQVSITFDNSTRFFPIDYSEVTIRRRVNREGISEYFLNEAPVRLRDVIDFFSKARLGTKGFSIINQGNSDLFIKASPQERRVMLEEVLGLRQYQIKRHEAETKLEATKINLDKASALVEELLPHLRVVRRQAGRYEKHATIESELKNCEYAYFSRKLKELHEELAKIEPEIKKFEEEITHKQRELKKLHDSLSEIERRQPQGDKGFNAFKKQQSDLLNRRSVLSKELGRLEAEMEFLLNRPKASIKESELILVIKDAKKMIDELISTDDVAAIKKQMREFSKRIDSVLSPGHEETDAKHKEIEKLKKQFTAELEELEKNLSELSGLESKLATDMREFNNQFKAAFEAVEAKKNEIVNLENHKNRASFDKERIMLRLKDLEHQAMQANRSIKEFYGEHEIPAEVKAMDTNELERRMLKLRGELAAIGEIDPALIEEARTMEERYNFLSGQIADLEKASQDLKTVIADLKEKIHSEFKKSLNAVNEEFNNYFRLMFNGGKAKLHLEKKNPPAAKTSEGEEGPAPEVTDDQPEQEAGLEVELSIPRKNIKGLDLLSGGERSLVSIAVLFALISVSPPPFLVLDEVDAALDENNTKRFSSLVENFSGKTQFMIVTHNRATMAAADVLYGVTMDQDGVSRLLSIKLEDAEKIVDKP